MMRRILFYLCLICGLSLIASGKDVCPVPSVCSAENCLPPDCSCQHDQPSVPLDLRPQIVYLTFDDAFTALAEASYLRSLFDGTFRNPDGCPIRATHFISARANDYSMVNKYHAMGHEIALHSITHRSPPEHWHNLTLTGWKKEIGGIRTMLNKFGKIPTESMKGVRAPFLQGGGDIQFQMMEELGLQYDCSIPSLNNGYVNMANGRWPFTLDYYSSDMVEECQVSPCPTCGHPGIWVQPMLDLEDDHSDGDVGRPCAMLDSCLFPGGTSEAVYEMLKTNFERAYNGNTRAPFGVYLHSAWFFGYNWRYDGYVKFIEYISSLDDVWIVPVQAGIEYKKHPVTNEELKSGSLPIFGCKDLPQPDCQAKHCRYDHVTNEDIIDTQEYITVCGSCPTNYPWLNNPEGF